MESEGKRSPSSGVGHGHLCTKCGWAFPNPHPSAKHRRAHKKHCGNIDGFPLIATATDLSDEDSGKLNAAGSESNHKNNPATDKTLDPYQAHAKKVQSLNVQIVADQMENGSQLKVTLPCHITISSDIENDRISASTCPKEIVPEDSSEKTGDLAMDALKRDFKSEKTDECTEIDVKSDVHNAGNTKANDIPLEATEETKAFDSNYSLIPEEQLVAGQNSNELFSSNRVEANLDGAFAKMELLNTMASLSQGKQINAAGRDSQSQLFCSGPCPVEINTGDNLFASSGAAPIENFYNMVGDCIVKGNFEENNMAALLMLSDISKGVIPEMENGLRKNDEHRACNVSVMYPNVEGGNSLGQTGEKLDAIETKVLDSKAPFTLGVQQGDESQIELFSCIGVKEFPVETYLQTKPRESKASPPLGEHLDAAGQDSHNEPDGSEGSPVVEDVESENVGAVRKSSVLDCLESDEMVHHPRSKTRESSGAQETDIVAPAKLDAERERFIEEQDTHHNSFDEIVSENHVVPGFGDCSVSNAFNIDEANNIINENQHINYGNIGNTGNDVIVCCREEPSKPESFSSGTKVDSEPKNLTSESKLLSVEIKGNGELESSKQIAAPTLHCSVLSPECTDIGHPKKFGPYSDELNIQNDTEEGTIELAASNDRDHPVTQADIQTEHVEKENILTRPLENLNHQKVPTQNLKSMSALYSDKLDNQESLLKILKDPAVHNNTSHRFTQDTVPIANTGKEINPDEQPHEDISLNDSGEDGVCDHGSYSLRLQGQLQGHTTSLVDPHASALIPVTLENVNSCDNSEVVPSPTHNQPLQEGGDHFASRQQSDAVLIVTNASADTSPTDSVEGGSVSDGLLVPNTETIPGSSDHRMEDLHTSDMESEATSAENSIGNVDRLEAPSYVTLEKSDMHPASSEIQPMQILQHTAPSQMELQTVLESQGENKNLQTNKTVIEWDSDKGHIRLKDLLAEAGHENKQKATPAHSHKMLLPYNKDQSSKMVPEHSNDSSSKVEHEEWNSPARLPITEVTKRKVKGKSTWLPFMCCSYIPKEIQ